MKLRIKVLGFISTMIVAMIIILYTCLKLIVLSNSVDVEQQFAINNIQRLSNFISYEIDLINGANQSMAEWDDSVDYITVPDPEYEENNLWDSAYTGNGVELIMYVDSQGEIVYEGTFNLEKKEKIDNYPETKEMLQKYKNKFINLQSGDSISGITRINNKLLLYTVRPILTSKAQGPSHGVIIIGRFFDKYAVNAVSKLMEMQIELLYPTPEILQAMNGNTIMIKQKSEEIQTVYYLLNDIDGNPVGIMSSDITKLVYNYGQQTLHYYLFAIIFICLLMCIAILWLLNRNVLSKIKDLTNSVDIIEKTGDLSLRIKQISNDELGRLGYSINGMLETLEKSRDKLEFLSMHDPLTGLYNRASFEKEIDNIKKNNIICVTIMICDIDRLKQINDSKGHKEGDKLLITVADIIKTCFREEDKLFRIGGDEFAAIFKVNNITFANSVYDRINDAVKDYNIGNNEFPISVSIGFACSCEEYHDIDTLFKKADDNMYHQKAEHHKQ